MVGRKRLTIGAVGIALGGSGLVTGGAVGAALATTTPAVYSACASSLSGSLYHVTTNGTPRCLGRDQAITRDEPGPARPVGVTGPHGQQGVAGAAGLQAPREPWMQPAQSAPEGLLTFLDRRGVEIADPVSGRVRLLVPFGSDKYVVGGPIWGTTPGARHPVVYFVLTGANPEAQLGHVFFRADPFTGNLGVVAKVFDPQGGVQDLAALPGDLVYTSACCEVAEVDALPLGERAASACSEVLPLLSR